MDFTKGMVVKSTAGRDSGYLLVVLEVSRGCVTVADGKERPLERPKRKNPKHLSKTNYAISLENITNKGLRKALRELLLREQECE